MHMIPKTEMTRWLPSLGSRSHLPFISRSDRTKLDKQQKSKWATMKPRVRNVTYLIDHCVNSFFFFLL